MPTYHYRCASCKHEFEEFQSMSEEPIKVCPSCGGETHRLISGGAGLIFKGSGFYITDYKRKGSGDAASGSTGSSSTSSSSTSSGSSGSSSSSGEKSTTGKSEKPSSSSSSTNKDSKS